jgi:CheY-like chemotaxis protein
LLKSASAAKRCPILLAEDSPDDAFFMQLALEKAALPNPLFVVCDGQEVIDYLEGAPPFTCRNLHPPPALVLLDIGMPRRDGFDVLSWLQTRPDLNHIPAVVFSGTDNQSDRKRARALGARAFHLKGVSSLQFNPLVQTVSELLAARQPVAPAALAAIACPIDEVHRLQTRHGNALEQYELLRAELALSIEQPPQLQGQKAYMPAAICACCHESFEADLALVNPNICKSCDSILGGIPLPAPDIKSAHDEPAALLP